jgi:hypothetical protein
MKAFIQLILVQLGHNKVPMRQSLHDPEYFSNGLSITLFKNYKTIATKLGKHFFDLRPSLTKKLI